MYEEFEIHFKACGYGIHFPDAIDLVPDRHDEWMLSLCMRLVVQHAFAPGIAPRHNWSYLPSTRYRLLYSRFSNAAHFLRESSGRWQMAVTHGVVAIGISPNPWIEIDVLLASSC